MSKFSGAFAATLQVVATLEIIIFEIGVSFNRILVSSNLTWSLFSAAQPLLHPTTPSWHKFSDLNWD